METSLDHLPESKRRELAIAADILADEFAAAISGGTMPYKRHGKILKIILFGSHARGDWVSDPVGGYVSDYDLLVVVNDDKLTDMADYWAKADERLTQEHVQFRRLSAPVSFIVHTLDQVNQALRRGRPFFVDIVRDGIAVFQAPGFPFEAEQPLDPAATLKEARDSFDDWFKSAVDFHEQAKHAIQNDRSKIAAFELHQAAERLYHCVLLVRKLYSPKSHKLNLLRSQAEQLDPRLIAAWPRTTRIEQRRFDLLRRAYVEARYSPHYVITREELDWLSERVGALQSLVSATCEERLSELTVSAASRSSS